jgi:hypothetical protein
LIIFLSHIFLSTLPLFPFFSMDGETFDIQLDTVGAEAVQQTLDALGVKAESVNHAAAAAEETTGTPGTGAILPTSDAAAAVQIDLAPLLAAQERTNDLLAAILAALEQRPVTTQPTY